MLKSGATYHYVSRRGEIDLSHTIEGSGRMEAELTDSGAIDILAPDLRIIDALAS